MDDIRNINWSPARTEPTDSPATMQVDFIDGIQKMLHADTDVSGETAALQAVHAALFN